MMKRRTQRRGGIDKKQRRTQRQGIDKKQEAPNLPLEIIEDIFSRLRVKSLLRCRCLSKQWLTLLTGDSYIQKHLKKTRQSEHNHGFILSTRDPPLEYYYSRNGELVEAVNFDESLVGDCGLFSLVGSSNGLICVRGVDGLYICNPATREYKSLPPPINKSVGRSRWFGFHSSDYKVVTVGCHDKGSEIEVYSLCTNSWRRLGAFSYISYPLSNATMMNGVVHWVSWCRNSCNHLIVSFDMGNESVGEIPLPCNLNNEEILIYWELRVFRGCLAILVQDTQREEGEGGDINVWVMKEYGTKESWTKLFTVEQLSIHSPLQTINGEIIFQEYENGSTSIVLYNFECRKFKTVLVVEHKEKLVCMDAVPYVESLVPVMAASSHSEYAI